MKDQGLLLQARQKCKWLFKINLIFIRPQQAKLVLKDMLYFKVVLKFKIGEHVCIYIYIILH